MFFVSFSRDASNEYINSFNEILSCRCIVTINVLWLFLTVPWVGQQYVIVVFPDHIHLLFMHRGFATIPTFHDIVSVILDLVSALAILQLLA